MTLRYGDVGLDPLRVGDLKKPTVSERPSIWVEDLEPTWDYTKGSGTAEQEYTVTDFENDPNTVRNFEIVTNYFEENKNKLLDLGAWGGDDDVSEFMRDRFFRISTLFSDSQTLEGAPDNVKQAYNNLRADWDRASVTGAGEHWELIKDYGTDIIASPEGLLTLGSMLFSGGTAAAPLTAAREVAKAGARSTLKGASMPLKNVALPQTITTTGKVGTGTFKTTQTLGPKVGKTRQILDAMNKRPVTTGAVYGGSLEGTIDVLEQDIDIETIDEITEHNYAQTVVATAFGAGFGAAAGKVASVISSKLDQSRLADDIAVEPETPDVNSKHESLEYAAADHKAEDMPFQTRSTPEIVEETTTPEGKAWARYNEDEHKIYINNSEVWNRWKDKAWTKPKEGVKALPEDQFKSFREFKDFVMEHEMAHAFNREDVKSAKGSPEWAANENKMNEIALESLKEINAKRNRMAEAKRVIRSILRQHKGVENREVRAKLTEELLEDHKEFQNLIEELGGSQQTKAKVIDELVATAYTETGEKQHNKMLFALMKPFTIFTSKLAFGKATAFLTPYESMSHHARLLGGLITKEYQIGTKAGQKVVTEDLSEAQHNIYGGLHTRYLTIMNDLTTTVKAGITDMFEVRRVMDDEVNDELMLAMRGTLSKGKEYSAAVNKAAGRMRVLFSDIGDQLGETDPYFSKLSNYIPREWKRSAIEANPGKLEKLLIADNQAPEVAHMKDVFDDEGQLIDQVRVPSAREVVEGMLDVENQLDAGGRAGLFFLNKRTLKNLEDWKPEYQEFLNTDVQGGFLRYIQGASNKLAKARVLGVNNFKEFEEKWINKIDADIRASGKKDMFGKPLRLSKKEKERMKDLYQGMTGEGLAPSGSLKDAYGLANRLAYLGFATLSSVTEALLTLGQMRPTLAFKGMKDAYNMSFKRMTGDLHTQLTKDYGLTVDEAWLELQRFGLAMEQGLTSTTDRLAGEGLRSETMQNVSNKFFRLNFLDQWTKFVQTSAFMSGKNFIFDLTKQLADHGDAPLTKRLQVARDRLSDLGINPDAAIEWHRKGKDTKNPWYVRNILNGASRYSRGVILDVGRMSGVKPRAFTSGLRGDTLTPLIGQLMGYPTAFTNTILKTGAKQLARDKHIAAEKLIPTAVLMTFVAGFNNYVRDRGQGWEDKDPVEVGVKAAARWGGLSMFYDITKRGTDSAMYSKNILAYPTALIGPVGSDVFNAVRGYPVATVGTKVPGYTLGKFVFGDEAMKDYRFMLRQWDKELKRALPQVDRGDKSAIFYDTAKGK